MKTLIDVGIACSGAQNPKWWGGVFPRIMQEIQEGDILINKVYSISSALPDWNKDEAIGAMVTDFAPATEKKRNQMTDANRLVMSRNFIKSDAEWLFSIDDDTVPPAWAITKLLAHDKKFIAGLYYNPNPPKNPLAYLRNPEGIGYYPLYNWVPGSLLQVDSVGMGCTLIHKDVFKAIMEAYDLRSRPNGSLFPIKKDAIYSSVPLNNLFPALAQGKPDIFVDGDYCFMKVSKVQEDDNRMWPFYVMEYGRTEDHHFCEMACEVGYRPWVDTTINCGHIKSWTMEYQNYRDYVSEKEGIK